MNLPPLDSVNFLDIFLGGLLLVFAVRGLFRGIIAELAGLAGFVLAIAVAGNSHVHGWMTETFNVLLNDSAWSNLLAYLFSFAAAFSLVVLAGRLMQRLIGEGGPGPAARLGGLVAGWGKGLVLCTITLIFLQYVAPGSLTKNTSMLVPHINSVWQGLESLTGGFQRLPDFTGTWNE